MLCFNDLQRGYSVHIAAVLGFRATFAKMVIGNVEIFGGSIFGGWFLFMLSGRFLAQVQRH